MELPPSFEKYHLSPNSLIVRKFTAKSRGLKGPKGAKSMATPLLRFKFLPFKKRLLKDSFASIGGLALTKPLWANRILKGFLVGYRLTYHQFHEGK
jgi:hypothetical protein